PSAALRDPKNEDLPVPTLFEELVPGHFAEGAEVLWSGRVGRPNLEHAPRLQVFHRLPCPQHRKRAAQAGRIERILHLPARNWVLRHPGTVDSFCAYTVSGASASWNQQRAVP